MEYHKIGERFEYGGVVLEVAKGRGNDTDCHICYFRCFSNCFNKGADCYSTIRKDKSPIYYKLVEQCKPKETKCKPKRTIKIRTKSKVSGREEFIKNRVEMNKIDTKNKKKDQ